MLSVYFYLFFRLRLSGGRERRCTGVHRPCAPLCTMLITPCVYCRFRYPEFFRQYFHRNTILKMQFHYLEFKLSTFLSICSHLKSSFFHFIIMNFKLHIYYTGSAFILLFTFYILILNLAFSILNLNFFARCACPVF